MMRSTSSRSEGPSNGCRVSWKWSRTISDGERSTHGTSVRAPRQNLEKRHRKPGSQVTPDSISTTFSFGYFANTPSVMRLKVVLIESGVTWLPGLAGVVLDVGCRPAERGY